MSLCVVVLFGLLAGLEEQPLVPLGATQTARVCICTKFVFFWDFILSLDLCPFSILDRLFGKCFGAHQ
jgi:hypothetical protein